MEDKESLAMLAFKKMLGSLYIDPTTLGFFNEAGEGDFVVVEKGYWTPPGQCTIVVCIKSFKPGVLSTPQDVQFMIAEAKRLENAEHGLVIPQGMLAMIGQQQDQPAPETLAHTRTHWLQVPVESAWLWLLP